MTQEVLKLALEALVRERDELQKQVWLYEKNGVTCQTYQHKVEQSCSECNVQITTPPKRTWVGLTEEEFQWIYDNGRTPAGMMEIVEAKLKELNT